uniref:Uncharacterized protein n=1 Tax=Zonotrichia albicollis TaxID=44394 RepID=A0A8D2QG12_ZONAL
MCHPMATAVLGPFGALEGWHLQSQASPFPELSVGRRGKPRSLWAGRLLVPIGGSSRDGSCDTQLCKPGLGSPEDMSHGKLLDENPVA